MNNLIISDQQELEQKLKNISSQGVSNLHVVSDFDRTLTYGVVNGKKRPSLISILRDGDYLDDDYAQKAHELYDKYSKYEDSSDLTLEEKKEKMEEWWKTHFQLLIDKELTKRDLKDIVTHDGILFRKGVPEFLQKTNQKDVPFIVFSSSGCGEAIKYFFKENNTDYSNVYFLVNQFIWDDGIAVDVKEPIIHSFNKDETVIKEISHIYNQIQDRQNVLLFGDKLSDLGMVKGFDYNHLLKIGFLNNPEDHKLNDFKKEYDIVVTNDQDFLMLKPIFDQIFEE